MARVIQGGRREMATHLYGAISERTADLIQSRIDRVREVCGDAYSHITNRLQTTFNRSALASINIAKNVLSSSKNMLGDGFRTLTDHYDFRTASSLEQDYLSSHPYFAEEIRKGRVNGWAQTRVDRYPDLTGELNPLYRQVTSGLIQYGDEDFFDRDEKDKMFIYFEHEEDNLRELIHNERFLIRNNWNMLYSLTNSDEEEAIDPTNIEGGYL